MVRRGLWRLIQTFSKQNQQHSLLAKSIEKAGAATLNHIESQAVFHVGNNHDACGCVSRYMCDANGLTMHFYLLICFFFFDLYVSYIYDSLTRESRFASTLVHRAWIDEYACNETERALILRTIPKLRILAFLGKETTRALHVQDEGHEWNRRQMTIFQRHFRFDPIQHQHSRDVVHGYFRDIYFESDFSRSLYLVHPERMPEISERHQIRIQCQRNTGRCRDNLDGAFVSVNAEFVVLVRVTDSDFTIEEHDF